MVRCVVLGLGLAAALWVSPAAAQEADRLPDGSVRGSQPAEVIQRVGETEIAVRFNRPSARGRALFGALVPYDSIWNPGADEATRISVSRDILIEGRPLAAGQYSVWAVPGPERWTIIFSRAHDVFHRPYPEGQDALRLTIAPETSEHVESLSFHFPEATRTTARLEFRWGRVVVPLRITTSPAEDAAGG